MEVVSDVDVDVDLIGSVVMSDTDGDMVGSEVVGDTEGELVGSESRHNVRVFGRFR